jgi:ferredoxin
MREDGARLHFDAIACDGVGICLLVAPSVIEPDSWGYPIVAGHPLVAGELRQARRAARACPHRALRVEMASATPAE